MPTGPGPISKRGGGLSSANVWSIAESPEIGSFLSGISLRASDRLYQCPEPEVRAPMPRVRLRTSGSKGALEIIDLLVSRDSEVRMRVSRGGLRPSESGHQCSPPS